MRVAIVAGSSSGPVGVCIFRDGCRPSEPVGVPARSRRKGGRKVPPGVEEGAISSYLMVAWQQVAGARREARRSWCPRRVSGKGAPFFLQFRQCCASERGPVAWAEEEKR